MFYMKMSCSFFFKFFINLSDYGQTLSADRTLNYKVRPETELMKEARPHRDDVSGSDVEGCRVVEVPVILQRSDLQDTSRICGGNVQSDTKLYTSV